VFWLALLCALAASSRALSAVRYVNGAAIGSNDGSSWVNAYTDLQAALAAAVSGDEIWVAAGTYKPTATTNRSVSFALKNGVGVYGGFLGNEASRGDRNPQCHDLRDIGAGETGQRSTSSRPTRP
jgi:hypothetical protein